MRSMPKVRLRATTSAPWRRLVLVGAALLSVVASCGKEPTAPSNDSDAPARFATGLRFNTIFPSLALPSGAEDLVAFNSVHVVVRHLDGSVALDTTFAFPAELSTLTVSLNVRLLASAPATGEPMTLELQYLNTAAQVVFRSGSVSVLAVPSIPGAAGPAPVSVPVTYAGPGAAATAVRISPRTLSVNAGAAFNFTAIAVDASGNTVPNTPIVWTTADPTKAQLPSALSGAGTALSARGTARIIAQLITAQSDTAILTVQPVASNLALVSGSGQTATVGRATPTTLPQPLIVRVTAGDGLPVSGVSVTFAATAGGGSLSPATATTDANGNAQTSWTLGNSPGVQSVAATSTGLAGSPVTFTATATAATATKLAIVTAPAANANITAGADLGISVSAVDVDNNVVQSFTGPITLALSSNAAGGTLGGTTTVNAVSGVASFGLVNIQKPGSAYAVTATATALTAATTPSFNVLTGPASSVVLVSGGGQTATASTVLANPVIVAVTDGAGNAKSGATVTFGVVTGGGSVTPISTTTDASGRASTTWTLGATVGAQTITASAAGVTALTVSASATAAAPTNHWVITQQPPASVTAGAVVSPAITAELRDASNALVASYNGTAAIALSTNPQSATLGGTTTVTAVNGVATFSTLTVNRTSTGNVLSVSSSGGSAGASNAFAVTSAAATTLALVSGGGQSGSFNAALAQPVIIKVTDAFGNGVQGVAIAFGVTAGGGSVSPTSTTTGSAGSANTNWTLGPSGTQSISVTASGLTGSPLTVLANNGPGPLSRTQLTPNPDTLTSIGGSQALITRGYDAGNNIVSGTFTYVSRNAAIATVSSGGVVTAVANGSTYVVATEAGGTMDSSLTVVQQRVATINVTPNTRTLYTGGTFQYSAQAVDGNGVAVASQPTFTWSSTAASVATVNATGLVTAQAVGSAQIRATAGSNVGVGNLTVLSPIRTIDVTFDSTNAVAPDNFSLPSLGVGRAYRAIARDTLGAVVTGVTFTWSSSNPSVALVDTAQATRAHVTSVANGNTSILASAQGTTGSASLTVAQVRTSIELTPAAVTVGVAGTTLLVARGKDANGRYISGGTFSYSSSAPTVASVNASSGLVTGVANGTADITATASSITSNAAVVTVSGSGPAIISFGRDTIGVGRGTSLSVPVLLSRANASNVVVNLSARDTNAYFSTATVTIPAGQTSVNATLNGRNAGTTFIYAADGSSTGYAPDTAVVTVAARVQFTNSSYALVSSDQIATQVLLSDPSPAGGTYVTFTYTTAGIVSISPDPAFIPTGQLAANVVITGTSSTSSSTAVTPTAAGVTGTPSTMTSYAAVLSETSRLLLGAGQYEPSITLSAPTYLNSPLTITLTSSDTTVATSTPSITIPSGQYYQYYQVNGRARGTANVVATAPGYTPKTLPVIVTTPRLRASGGGSYNLTSTISMSGYVSDSLNSSHPRSSSLTVRVSSSDTTVVRVVDSVVTIAAGSTSTPTISLAPGGAGGTAYVRLTASGHNADSVLYTISAPALTLNGPAVIGAGQQDGNYYVQIPNTTSSAVVVNLSSSDPSVFSVPSTVTLPANSANYIYFTGVAVATGAVTVTATASGYGTITKTVRVSTPRLAFSNSATLNTFQTANVGVIVRDSVTISHPRTAALTVTLRSTDTNVLTVDSSAVIAAGQASTSSPIVTGIGAGTAYVVLSAPGQRSDSLLYTVSAPSLSLSFTTTFVGRNTRTQPSSFNVQIPSSRGIAIPVTLTHQNPTRASSASSVTIPANSYYQYFDLMGLANGVDTLIVSAAGYRPDTGFIRVNTPKIIVSGLPSTTTTTNPGSSVTVYVVDSTGGQYGYQTAPFTLHAVSSDTNVIRVTAPYVSIPAGSVSTSASITYVGVGTASVTYSDSAGLGFTPATTNTVTVTGPSLSISGSSAMLGMRQQYGPGDYYVSVPNNVSTPLTVTLTSSSTRVATVPATVTIPANSYYAYFRAYAQDTIGTIQIQASATGYSVASQTLQVTQPKFTISTGTSLTTTSPAQSFYVYATDANGNYHQTTESVAVTIASSAPGVASFDSTIVHIDSGAYYSGVAKWSPVSVGTAQLSATDARSAFYRYNPASVSVSVATPAAGLSFTHLQLGIGQYADQYVSLPNSTTSATTVPIGHAATPRTSTPASTVIPSGSYYSYFRITGSSVGPDTITVSPAGHTPARGDVVVALGRIDPYSLPTSVSVGDSTLVTFYAQDQNQNTHYVASATTFNLSTPNGKARFVLGGVQVTTITIPADAQYVQVYLKGIAAGSENISVSNANYTTYTNSITISP